MKRVGTVFVAIGLGLLAATPALAATPNPFKVIGAPTSSTWTGIAPSDVRRPSDVRQGIRRANTSLTGIGARSWSDGARPS